LAVKSLIIARDLNLTTSSREIWGERAKIDPLSKFYKHLFSKNTLVDLKLVELLPTWRNGRVGSTDISKRLDRFMVGEMGEWDQQTFLRDLTGSWWMNIFSCPHADSKLG
jgi:hypothetical protein